MKQQHDCSFWELCMRLIWLLIFGASIIAALRLMAWADTGSRGECPIEKNIIPTK